MAKTKSNPASPFRGRWHITSMSTWDEDYFNDEVQAYIDFKEDRMGEFQFGYVQGDIDHREGLRGGEPAVEWTWEGVDGDDMAPLSGRGWAVLKDDELHGMIFIHMADESDFNAIRTRRRRHLTRSR